MRLLSATASAVVGDRPHGKSSYRHSLDCGNGVGAADDGNFDQFGLPPPPSVPRRGANGASSRYGGVDDEAAALVRVNSDARARVSGAAGGLASSVGSFGSSSLGSRRSTAAGIGGDGGAEGGRKRVELRTPAEEEAVRRVSVGDWVENIHWGSLGAFFFFKSLGLCGVRAWVFGVS